VRLAGGAGPEVGEDLVDDRVAGKNRHVVLDQIRTVDQERLGKRLGALKDVTMLKVLAVLQAMFAT
jgi:mRNA-degrading endonuclease toxin of MazEF toxin-antitoxin module